MPGKKKRSAPPPLVPQRPRIPVSQWFRMLVLGSVSIIACVWAIWRHYHWTPAPMLVPVAPAADAGPGTYDEIEVEPPP
jgi:hypothetical protein